MKILITGASSGIGAELARQYASKENELILLARREDKLFELRKELYEEVKNIDIIVADVTEFTTLQKKIKTIGSIDMVILNAGVATGGSSDIPTIESFKNLYDVNVLSNHAILEVLLPLFREQGSGKIVFMSSLASLISMPSSEIYSSSKRALNAYAEGIRYKYKPYGIKIITILPGFIKSEMTDQNEFKMPFIYSTQEGVSKIKGAIETNREFYAFPLRLYHFIRFVNLLPAALRERMLRLFR